MHDARLISRFSLLASLLALSPLHAAAMGMMIDGITVGAGGIDLVADDGYIATPDANVHFMWGYGVPARGMQYPGPTLIVQEGDLVVIRLRNNLGVTTSMVFPGQTGVSAAKLSGNTLAPLGPLALEAAPGETVEYSFIAGRPGTFLYHSGTSPELQTEMGLVGALIVRPAGFMMDGTMRAYGHPGSWFDHEVLVLETELDPRIHLAAEYGQLASFDTTTWFPTIWFINGRAAPDTMADANVPWLPRQPYNCMPMMHPGQRVLMRILSAGRDEHPFHFHGNHAALIARDAFVLQSGAAVDPAAYPDLSEARFTLSVPPGGTADAIYTWEGRGLGWDIYGHKPDKKGVCPAMAQGEDPANHCKPFPVALPDPKDVTVGELYGGSPFLGQTGPVPPGQPAETGYYFMWHSHNEKEMTTDDVFPGGMMTMLRIEPWGVLLPGEGQ